MSCKVDRLEEKYGVVNLNQRLEERYAREDTGLRDLERFVNRSVLKRAIQLAGETVVDGEVENLHRLLTSDDVDTSAEEEARRQLRAAGVDVDRVETDMVCYQTVRKHLNECIGVDTSDDYEPDLRADREGVEKLIGRAVRVSERKLEKLRRHGVARIGPPTVTVDIRVRCGDCHRSHDLLEFLRDPVCDCRAVTEADSAEPHPS